MNITPLEDRVLIAPLDADTHTPGGIFLPDNAQEKSQRGVVLAAGPGKMEMGQLAVEGCSVPSAQRLEMSLRVGDSVIYSKYAGTEIKIDGESLMLMREADVLAVVTESP